MAILLEHACEHPAAVADSRPRRRRGRERRREQGELARGSAGSASCCSCARSSCTSSGAAPPAKSAVLEFSTERRKPMRLALAQINSVVGDVDGNADRIVEWLGRARDANADLVLFPELCVTGYPAEDLLLRPGFVRAARARSRGDREGDARRHRARRRSASRHGPLQRVLRACPRRGALRLPQALPPELRSLRRGPLLRARRRPLSAPLRRRDRRPDDLRGRLAARAAGDGSRARRRAADREHLRVAVPRRQGPRARRDAEGARARQLLLLRAVQRGRRPGRADLRRPLRGARRRGRDPRARRRLRGGAARRRRRPGRGDRPAPP